MNDELLKKYKELPDIVINNLDDLLSYKACYDYDSNISDEMVLLITSIAHNCWLEDEYSKASKDYYTEYLLNAVYDYGATKEQLKELDYSDIVEAYNDERDVLDLLKFNTEDYEYCFTTTDNKKYYSADEGFYVVDEEGIKIQDPHPMANPIDDIFDLLNENKIKDMPLSMHYNIRCIIKNDILGDEELEERYKSGIENYKSFCKKRFIISRDIENVTALAQDINLTKEDELYTDESKMSRLQNVIQKKGSKNIQCYEYVASFSNGTDYYYNNEDKMYLAIDKNDVTKFFDDDSIFLLKELNKKDKIVYLKPNEVNKIVQEFSDVTYEKIEKNVQFRESIHKFVSYNKTKELQPFTSTNKHIALAMDMVLAIQEWQKDEFKKRIQISREMKKRMNEVVMKEEKSKKHDKEL